MNPEDKETVNNVYSEDNVYISSETTGLLLVSDHE